MKVTMSEIRKELVGAILELQKVTSVEEWNNVRDKHKDYLNTAEIGMIDTSGLIVEVLGQDILETKS